ncbi:MAG: hypothetical protein NTW21_23145 [Verrucomicrobia bacterium]|nr:hypothetical protein [Verrucomicrobiota bacterium]
MKLQPIDSAITQPTKLPFFRPACLALAVLSSAVFSAQAFPLSVSQGRTSQRTGTRLVDVYYDISGGNPPYTVRLWGSLDGGSTWTLPVTTVSGHVGAGVTAGTNRL